MIKFSFFIGLVLVLITLLGIPSIYQRWAMGLAGLALVLFSSYLKFYIFSNKKNKSQTEKTLIEEEKKDEQPSIDLKVVSEKETKEE